VYGIMLGTNDVRYNCTLQNFADDYETLLNRYFAAGVDPAVMFLCSLPAATDVQSSYNRQLDFSNVVRALATKYNLGFADVLAATKAIGATAFQGDQLHLSEVIGHSAAANTILSMFTNSRSGGPLYRFPWG
jgi:hypothetical protein